LPEAILDFGSAVGLAPEAQAKRLFCFQIVIKIGPFGGQKEIVESLMEKPIYYLLLAGWFVCAMKYARGHLRVRMKSAGH